MFSPLGNSEASLSKWFLSFHSPWIINNKQDIKQGWLSNVEVEIWKSKTKPACAASPLLLLRTEAILGFDLQRLGGAAKMCLCTFQWWAFVKSILSHFYAPPFYLGLFRHCETLLVFIFILGLLFRNRLHTVHHILFPHIVSEIGVRNAVWTNQRAILSTCM